MIGWGKKLFTLFSLVMLTLTGKAQTGETVYNFLNLGFSPRISALGGINVSSIGFTPDIVHFNPAFLTHIHSKAVQLSYVNYYAGINYGNASYISSGSAKSAFATGITFLNYGTFTGADASGNITGEFRASEYSFAFSWARPVYKGISGGISVKPVLSHLEEYTSFGIVFDLGAAYLSSDSLFTAGLTIRNAGIQITDYAGREKASPPFEIVAGATLKLAHAPFRFSATAIHLETWDLVQRYSNESVEELINSEFGENILRHLVFGVEFIPSDKFYLASGFNYLRRSELAASIRPATVGFSWGAGFRLPWFDLEYGRSLYHISGPLNNFSVTFNPQRVFEKVIKN